MKPLRGGRTPRFHAGAPTVDVEEDETLDGRLTAAAEVDYLVIDLKRHHLVHVDAAAAVHQLFDAGLEVQGFVAESVVVVVVVRAENRLRE